MGGQDVNDKRISITKDNKATYKDSLTESRHRGYYFLKGRELHHITLAQLEIALQLFMNSTTRRREYFIEMSVGNLSFTVFCPAFLDT